MILYDVIGTDYDSTRQADPHIVRQLIRHLKVQPGEDYLDLACGTGNYSLALGSGTGAPFFAMDQSAAMIRSAAAKSSSVTWCVGEAEALPFSDGVFGGMTCVLGIHHFRDSGSAFGEAHRVLTSGRLVVFTASPVQMRGYWLNAYFPSAMAKSIRQMPADEEMERELRSAGFREITTETYSVQKGLKDLFLYSGKHCPQIYLDPLVRKGISTFASLACQEEIEEGCERLARDLRTGRFQDVISEYRGELGDYLFVVARK